MKHGLDLHFHHRSCPSLSFIRYTFMGQIKKNLTFSVAECDGHSSAPFGIGPHHSVVEREGVTRAAWNVCRGPRGVEGGGGFDALSTTLTHTRRQNDGMPKVLLPPSGRLRIIFSKKPLGGLCVPSASLHLSSLGGVNDLQSASVLRTYVFPPSMFGGK